MRLANVQSLALVFISTVLMTSCKTNGEQSTEPQALAPPVEPIPPAEATPPPVPVLPSVTQIQPAVDLAIKVELPDINEQEINDNISEAQPQVLYPSEQALTYSLKQQSRKHTNPKVIDKTVCKDMEALLTIANQNGRQQQFTALVQAQAKIQSASLDGEHIEVKVTGFYVHDETLRGWQPYLSRAPYSESLILERDKVQWTTQDGWSICQMISS